MTTAAEAWVKWEEGSSQTVSGGEKLQGKKEKVRISQRGKGRRRVDVFRVYSVIKGLDTGRKTTIAIQKDSFRSKSQNNNTT